MTSTMLAEEHDERLREQALDGLQRVRLAGPLTAATAGRVRTMIEEAAQQSAGRLLLDLQAVTALDAAGVAALLDGHRQVAAQGRGVMVLRPNRIVARALKSSGTIAAFSLWNSAGM